MIDLFSPGNGINSTSDKEKVAFVTTQLFEAAKKFRQKYDLRWYMYNSYYDGNSWIMYSKSSQRIETVYVEEWRNKFSVPDVFVAHRSMKSLILNKDPVYDAVPTANDNDWDPNAGDIDPATGKAIGSYVEGPKVKAAKMGGDILEYLERKIDLPGERNDVADDALKMGNGYWKFGFDQEYDNGVGEICTERISPYSVYIDPNCTKLSTFKNCRYVIYVVPRDVRYIELKYGKKVEADNKESSSSYESMYKQQKTGSGSPSKDTNNSVLVYECWVNEPYAVPLTITNDLGQEEEVGENIVKYRMRCITCTKEVLLRDVYDPLHTNEFPFEAYQVNLIPGEIYADGIIKQQMSLIDQANRRLSQVADNATRMTNPRILAPRGSILPDEFSDLPGEIVEYTVQQEAKPEIMEGSNVAPDVMNLADFSLKKAQDAAGIHEVSRGVLPPGINSGRQLELAQSADTMVLGPYIHDLEAFLKRSGKKILNIVKANYPSERTVVMKGKQGQLKTLNIIPSDIDFSDVNVEISSFLANTKAGRQDILSDLQKQDAIDPQTLLEYFDFPDIDAIVQRLHKHQERQAQMKQGAQNQEQQPPQQLAQIQPPIAR